MIIPRSRVMTASVLIALTFLVFCLSPTGAVGKRINLKRELRKCSTRRRKYKRLVVRRKKSHYYTLTEGGASTLVVVKRNVVQSASDRSVADQAPTLMKLYTEICKALRAASDASDREFFDTYQVRYARIPNMFRVWYPTLVRITPRADVFAPSSSVPMDYRIKGFRLGAPSAEETNPSCLADVQECEDGSFVSRNPNKDCQFDDCPSTTTSCSKDAKECPDGSYVSRDYNNNCQFKPCPSTTTFCTEDAKECPDGSYVSRDHNNNCQFKPCPDNVEGAGATDKAAILAKRDKWDANFGGGNMRNYKYSYKEICRCHPDYTRTRQVTVIDGKIAEVVFDDDPTELAPKDVIESTRTIEELFDDLASGAGTWDSLSVDFDYYMGYPSSIKIDKDVMMADEEKDITIESVVMLKTTCPADLGSKIGSPCSASEVGLTCNWGSESCCGNTYASIQCSCEQDMPSGEGTWMCLQTDRCFAPCDP